MIVKSALIFLSIVDFILDLFERVSSLTNKVDSKKNVSTSVVKLPNRLYSAS